MKTWIVITCAALAFAGACSEDGNKAADAGPDSGEACQWDEDNEPAAASPVGFGSAVEGYVCPQGDQDWYSFSIGAGAELLKVDLSVDAPVSPLNLTYGVWDGAAAEVLNAPQSTESAMAAEPLSIVHRLEAGSYYLVVRDRGDDSEDVWHPYYLTLDAFADPDANEINNTVEQATPFASGSMEGYIAYRGDEDWFAIDAAAHDLLQVRLTMPAGGIEPSYRVVDTESVILVNEVNEAGKFEPTDLSYVQALPTAGTYYVVVQDDDSVDYDYDVPYSLELSLSPDPDANEANDHPNEATALGALNCNTNVWTSWVTNTGYLASNGDIDWFELELSSCSRSLLEVEVDFESPGSLPADFQATARLVRRIDSDTYACEIDSECVELPKACDYGLDCRLMGNTCLASGVCAGAGACIDPGRCGANYISETAPEATPGSVTVSAPLYGWTSPFPIYVAVADYQADAYSIDHSYTVRARVRRDPDLNELPSEAYTAGPPEADDPAIEHIAFAQEIPVHDCTAADCCGSGTWIEGYLSYAYDQDWYAYPHPCPGQDCMVRVVYDFDGGAVDFYMQVYEGDNAWFDNLSDTTDPGNQSAKSGYFGGLDAADYCFYAYSGHEGDPFYYYIPIRDTVYVAEGQEEDGTWDWSPEQSYRLCVEKVANGCVDPCFLYEDGCGAP